MIVLLKKEFLLYFITPIGYIFMSIFLFINGWYLLTGSLVYGNSDLTAVFASMYSSCLFLVPILTMRSFTEEKRQKTYELLLTSGITKKQIVLSKLAAPFLLFALGSGITLFYGIAMSMIGSFSFSLWAVQWIGSCLMSLCFIAISGFISSLASSQTIAVISSFATLYVFDLFDSLPFIQENPFLHEIFEMMSPLPHYKRFVNGYVGIEDVTYFVILSGLFVYLSIFMQSRKERGAL